MKKAVKLLALATAAVLAALVLTGCMEKETIIVVVATNKTAFDVLLTKLVSLDMSTFMGLLSTKMCPSTKISIIW